jgi:hypothetical protein
MGIVPMLIVRRNFQSDRRPRLKLKQLPGNQDQQIVTVRAPAPRVHAVVLQEILSQLVNFDLFHPKAEWDASDSSLEGK